MEKTNILYLYLQRKLLEAANNIHAKNGYRDEKNRIDAINNLKEIGKLNVELKFGDAQKVLAKHHNISSRVITPILYEMRNLNLIKIEGYTNHLKVKIINIHKGKLIDQSNKLYRICF